jgi:hypothetical protein
MQAMSLQRCLDYIAAGDIIVVTMLFMIRVIHKYSRRWPQHQETSAGSLPGPYNPVVYFGPSSTLFDALAHYDTPEWRFAVDRSNILNRE